MRIRIENQRNKRNCLNLVMWRIQPLYAQGEYQAFYNVELLCQDIAKLTK